MEITKQQKKVIIITAGVLFVGVVGYFVLKPKKQDTGGQWGDPTNNNDIPNNTLFDPAKTAETLYQSMKDIGTDEDLIFFTLKNINQNQFAKVIEAFGTRNYNYYAGNTLSFVKHPLTFWLRNELSDSDYSTLRLKYPNHL